MSPTIDGPGAERWRDLDLERSVLGAVLLAPDLADRYRAAGLTPVLFSHPAHGAIWRAAADLAADGARPDFPLLRLRLQDRGELEEAGGPAYLARLLDDGLRPDPANIAAHVGALVTLARCRRAFYATMTLRQALDDDPAAINNGVLAKLTAAIDEVPAGSAAAPAWVEGGPAFARHAEAALPGMLVGGLIPGDGLTLIHADPRSLKTWIAQDAGLALASGTPALGTLATAGPAPVLYLSNEDSRQRTADRLLKLARGRGLSALPDTLLCGVHAGVWLDDPVWQAQILALVKARGVRLVILDPLRSLTGAVDQGPADFRPFGQYVRTIAEAGAAVLMLHHDTKPLPGQADTRKRAYRASGGGLFSAADAPIHAERVGDEPVVLLHPNSWKFSETPGPLEVRLTVTADTAFLVATATTSTSATDRELAARVVAYVTANPDRSGNKIAEGIRARREVVSRVLEDLAGVGVVDSRPGPRNSACWFISTVSHASEGADGGASGA